MYHPLRSAVAVAALLIGGLSPRPAAAADIGPYPASIVVRTYTQPASAGDMAVARRTAGAILKDARIAVEWVECVLPVGAAEAPAPCRGALRWNELMVRVVPAGAIDNRRDVSALGTAIIDREAGGGSLATVYADRVALAAQRAGVSESELLGRALAHEIGHLLLGTNQHAANGLMRSAWSPADLQRNLVAHWRFRDSEHAAMRLRLESRRLVAMQLGRL